MLCLVTGVPGIGKSTICSTLAEGQPDRYRHVSFGRLILEALTDHGVTGVSEQDLRRRATELVTKQVLKSATALLAALVDRATDHEWLLIDSHAVSQDWYGYRATPDGSDYFAIFTYAAVVQLFAESTVVLERGAASTSGRYASTPGQLDLHFQLQAAVSISYGAQSACPVFFVDAAGEVADVAATVDTLLNGLDIST